jgi:hypothetical protein
VTDYGDDVPAPDRANARRRAVTTGQVWGGARLPEAGQVACRMHGTRVQACGARRVAPGRHVLLRELGAWGKKREAEGPQGVRSIATLSASLSIPFTHLRKCQTRKSDN